MTISRRMASVFFMFLDMIDLSVLAKVNAACVGNKASEERLLFCSRICMLSAGSYWTACITALQCICYKHMDYTCCTVMRQDKRNMMPAAAA